MCFRQHLGIPTEAENPSSRLRLPRSVIRGMAGVGVCRSAHVERARESRLHFAELRVPAAQQPRECLEVLERLLGRWASSGKKGADLDRHAAGAELNGRSGNFRGTVVSLPLSLPEHRHLAPL